MKNRLRGMPLAERYFLFIILILAIFIMIDSFKYSFTARILPQIFSILVIVFSVLVIINLISREVCEKEENIDGLKRLQATVIILLSYFFALYFVGYLISTILSVFVYSRVLGMKKITTSLITAIIITISMYIVFQVIFLIPLPVGLLFKL